MLTLVMQRALLVVVAALIGCSTDASGLGGDFVVVDGAPNDSTVGYDETNPLFPGDDGAVAEDSTAAIDSSEPADTELPDTELPDTELPDTEMPDTKMPDTETVDAAPETIAIDAPASDGALTPTPGKVTCDDEVCAAGEACCSTSSGFSCMGTCSFTAAKFRCDEKSDCPSGEICCAEVSWTGSWYGTVCRAPEWCFSAQVCTSSAGCDGGKTCAPIKPSGAPTTMGYCK